MAGTLTKTPTEETQQAYNTKEGSAPPFLSDAHRRMLLVESGISPEIVAERGVRTITHGRELPSVFSRRQKRRGSGILFTVHRPSGETSYNFRPDEPDPEKPGRKYEQPSKHYGGPGNVLDVHPSTRHLIDRTDVPVMFVEGIKKGDAILTAAKATGVEVLVVVVSGVWNFLSAGGDPIPDLLDIPVEGREVGIVYDSDMLSKEGVQSAAARLAEFQIGRGATVRLAFLPDAQDGSKVGADDFLVSGKSYADLCMSMRTYDPGDFERVRLSRDEKLKALVEDLDHTFWGHRWIGQGGHSDRSLFKELICEAARSGKPHKDGVRVKIDQRTLEERVGVSSRTIWKAIKRLGEGDSRILGAGLIYRDNEGRKANEKGAFVLRASVRQKGGREAKAEEGGRSPGGDGPPVLHLRASRFRWSDPGSKARAGLVKGTRKVRQMKLPARPPTKRLGKMCEADVDRLDAAGGELPLDMLAAASSDPFSGKAGIRARERYLLRESGNVGDKNHRMGPLLQLIAAGVVECFGDVARRCTVVRFTSDWLEALERSRELGGEVEAERLTRERHKRQRTAYREFLRGRLPEVSHHPANAKVPGDGWIEDLVKLPKPPDTWQLYELMNRGIPVGTPQGSGQLWQVFSDQVGVVLDVEPERVAFFDPAELILQGAA